MRVTISGGVHGNELTGIYIVKKLQHVNHITHNISLDYLLANPKAIAECRRYIDVDLNRSFTQEALRTDSHLYEYERAKVIKERLKHSDFLIDLHTTTANMGITIVLSALEPRALNVAKILAQEYEDVRILLWLSNSEGAFINSLVPASLTIEVGPICQGVLHSELFFKTLKVLHRAIDILDKDETMTECAQAFKIIDTVDFPRKGNELFGMIHPELNGKDYKLLHRNDPVFLTFDEEEIFYQGDDCYPVFINEAAYYEKKIAFCTTQMLKV